MLFGSVVLRRAMSRTLPALLLVAAMLGLSSPQELVPGSCHVLFQPSATGLSTQDTHLLAQDFAQNSMSTIGISSSQTTTYKVGTLSILAVSGIADSKIKTLSESASALGGTLSLNHVVRLDLPRAPFFPQSTSVRPEAVCTPNCPATCTTRSLIMPGLHNLDWLDLHSGDTTYCSPAAGSVRTDVFILDTGVEITHPDLAGLPIERFDCQQPGQTSWTLFEDLNGHGTHVTGTIGSAKYGLTPNVNIHMIKVLDDTGSGGDMNLICGLSVVSTWLDANPTKKCVVSMSLGYGSNVPSINTVFSNFANTYASRVVVVVAAGNSAVPACSVSLGAVPELIVVGSTSPALAQSYFSNYGSCCKIFANGESILSTYKGGTTARLSGTSMATPLVAAACAEYFRNNPTATGSGLIATITGSATSDLHASGLLTSLSSGTPNKLVKYSCPGGCNVANICQNNPCLNGGTCTPFTDQYHCDCVSGFTGGSCETNINECLSLPCQNGGTCNDLVNAYTCTCPSGWIGTACQTVQTGCTVNQRTPNTSTCEKFYLCSGGIWYTATCPCVSKVRWVYDLNTQGCTNPTLRTTKVYTGCKIVATCP